MATVIDDLLVRLGFDADTSGAKEFDTSLGNILGTVTKVGLAVAGIAAAAGTFVGKGFLDTAIQFENFETQLTTIEGSADKAKKSLDWISEFGAKTPYDVAQVTDAFVKLKSYGLDPIEGGLLTSLGNTASAMGKDLTQAVEMIADAVRGENERLKEFGIIGSKNKDEMTYTYDINGEAFEKTVANESKDIQSALQEIMDEKFRGGMEAMSKTWEGTVSNMGDTWTMMKRRVMDRGIFQKLKEELNGVMLKIFDNSDAIDEWADRVGDNLIVAFDWVKDTLFDVWDAALWTRDAFKSLSETLGITEHGGKILAGVLALLAANMVGFAVLSMIARLQALVMVVKSLTGPIALIGAAIIILGLAIQDIYGYLNGQDSFVGQMMADHPAFKAFVDFIVNNFKLIIALIGVMIGAYVMMKAAAIAGFLLSMTTGLLSYALLAAGAIAAGLATAAAWIIAFAPFLLIAAIVAGVIAIFWQLYKNWAAIWDGIKSIASSVGDFIMGIFRSIGDAFGWVWDKVKMLMGVKVPDVDLKTTQSIEQVFGDPKAGFSQSSGYWKDSISPAVSARPAGYQGNTNNSTVNQNINVNSANEAAMIAARTAQGSREQSNGYQ